MLYMRVSLRQKSPGDHHSPVGRTRIQTASEVWSSRDSHTWLVEMQTGAVTLEDSFLQD